jgi:hypothetical protein
MGRRPAIRHIPHSRSAATRRRFVTHTWRRELLEHIDILIVAVVVLGTGGLVGWMYFSKS